VEAIHARLYGVSIGLRECLRCHNNLWRRALSGARSLLISLPGRYTHQKNTWNLELHHNTRAQILHLSLRLHYLSTRCVVLDVNYVLEII